MKELIKFFTRTCLSPLARARAVRSDDRGQVTLLAGVMVFLIMIMTIFTFNTSKAIYNRIIAQNAVDSAADAAALWQARGCNLLQHLNNLHYDINVAAYVLEAIALAGCVAAPILLALSWLITQVPATVACVACAFAPLIDWAQENVVKVLMAVQKVIAEVFPYIAFGYGNAAAKGSGADKLIGTVLGYADGVLDKVGLSVPSLGSIGSELDKALDWLPLYAAPLDPTSLSLHVEEKEGSGAPWVFNGDVAKGIAIVGKVTCTGLGVTIKTDLPDEWGWKDSYYYGNPGFMTWIAGKKPRGELLGLGNLVWLSGGKKTPQQMEDIYDEEMYTGSSDGSGSPLSIPAFVALASSQVDGDPVVSKGDVNAKGHLITVHFPPDDDPIEGKKFLIYH